MNIFKAILVTFLLFIIGLMLSLGFQILLNQFDVNPQYLFHYNAIARILIKLLQYSIILFLVFKLWFHPTELLTKIRTTNWENLLLILIVSIGFEVISQIFLDLKTFVSSDNPKQYSIYQTAFIAGYGLIYDLIRAVILAPILEELLFRKVLFSRLLNKYPFGVSAFISSICFALIHIPNWFNLLPTFIFGIICCLIYTKTKNIIYPILLHFTGNLIVFISSIYNRQFFGLIDELNYNWFYWIILIFGISMTIFGVRRISQVSPT